MTWGTAQGDDTWPDGMEMIRQVREALGLFAGAMPVSPRQAWEEALDKARRLAGTDGKIRADRSPTGRLLGCQACTTVEVCMERNFCEVER